MEACLRVPMLRLMAGICMLISTCGEVSSREPKPDADAQGDPLPAGAVARLGTTRFRHPGLTKLVFSPDGKTLFTAGNDQTVRAFRASTGEPIHAFPYAEQYIAFAEDGKRVALWTRDGLIRFCDPASGREMSRLQAHPVSAQRDIVLFPDGRTVVTTFAERTGEPDGFLYFFDVASGKETRKIGAPYGDADSLDDNVTVSPDGRLLATSVASRRGPAKIILWNTQTGKQAHVLKGVPDFTLDMAFSPDGMTLASAHWRDADVVLWNPGSGEERARLHHKLSKQSDGIRCLTFSRERGLLAATNCGDTTYVWDLATQKMKYAFPVGPDVVPAFSPDGKHLAAGHGSTIVLWNLETGQREPMGKAGHEDAVKQLIITSDGKSVVSHDGRTARLWDMATAKETRLLSEPVLRMALSSDGRRLATLGSNSYYRRIDGVGPLSWYVRGVAFEGPLKIWDLTSDAKPVQVHLGSTCRDVVFAPDLSSIAVADWFGHVDVYDVTGKKIQRWGGDELLYSPDGKLLLSRQSFTLSSGKKEGTQVFTGVRLLKLGQEQVTQVTRLTEASVGTVHATFTPDSKRVGFWTGKKFHLCDVASGKVVREFDSVPAAFLPDGKTLVFRVGKELAFRDADIAKERFRLKGVGSLWRVLPDGRTFAAVLEDGKSIGVWETVGGKEIVKLLGHQSAVSSLAVHGQILVSGFVDGTSLVWRITRKE